MQRMRFDEWAERHAASVGKIFWKGVVGPVRVWGV